MVHTVVDHIKALHIQINKLILNKMEHGAEIQDIHSYLAIMSIDEGQKGVRQFLIKSCQVLAT